MATPLRPGRGSDDGQGMRRKDWRIPADLDDDSVFEIAHLYCVCRLTGGAIHTWNNALTAVSGPLDLPREQPELDLEVARCAQVTRSLTRHHARRIGRGEEAELVSLVRTLCASLVDLFGRSLELEIETPDDFLCLEADPAAIELVVLILVLRLSDVSQRSGPLRVAVARGEKPDTAHLLLEIRATDPTDDAEASLIDPNGAESTGLFFALEALHRIVARLRASLDVRSHPDGLLACVSFPLLQD